MSPGLSLSSSSVDKCCVPDSCSRNRPSPESLASWPAFTAASTGFPARAREMRRLEPNESRPDWLWRRAPLLRTPSSAASSSAPTPHARPENIQQRQHPGSRPRDHARGSPENSATRTCPRPPPWLRCSGRSAHPLRTLESFTTAALRARIHVDVYVEQSGVTVSPATLIASRLASAAGILAATRAILPPAMANIHRRIDPILGDRLRGPPFQD